MAVTLNKANLVLKDANGNIGKIEQLSNRDLAKIKTAVSDVALVVNQSNHTPIAATTTNKGVVQLATSSDVASGAIDKVVTAEQLHNVTTGTSALASENLARIDAVVTAAGISVDHTNTNQLKTAVTTLISKATPATATANTLGVVKPDNNTIKINSNGVLTATAKMPGVATTTNVGVVKPDGSTITINSNGVLTATRANSATNATKAAQDSAGQQINTTYIKGVTASNATITVTKGNGTTSTATINNVANATKADSATNATNATKASQNASGYALANTIVKSIDISGRTITVTKIDNTSYTLTTQDTNTTYTKLSQFTNDAGFITSTGSCAHAKTADSATNATNLGGYPATKYIRSVNSITPNSNGNVVLNLSSIGVVGFPNLNASVAISNFNGTYTSNTTKTYTLPASGWVIGNLSFSSINGGSDFSLYLGTVPIYNNIHISTGSNDYTLFIPLKSSNQIKLQVTYKGGTLNVSSSLKFYPFLS